MRPKFREFSLIQQRHRLRANTGIPTDSVLVFHRHPSHDVECPMSNVIKFPPCHLKNRYTNRQSSKPNVNPCEGQRIWGYVYSPWTFPPSFITEQLPVSGKVRSCLDLGLVILGRDSCLHTPNESEFLSEFPVQLKTLELRNGHLVDRVLPRRRTVVTPLDSPKHSD